jgi:double zinc ribbon protein
MRCRSCQFDNPAGMRFCGQCGAPLALACPACGADAPAGFRFCGQCGAALQPSAPAVPVPPAAPPTPAWAASVQAYTPRHLADKILRSRAALEGEVAKTLLDLGLLRREGDRLTLVKGAGSLSVPGTIQDIIMARLDRLGENGKRTVQLASVIGRQFLVRLLTRVSGMSGEPEGLLRELQALELVYEKGLLPEPAYIFKHAVIQDVAYNSLLRERRKDLHRAVGRALEDLYPDRLAEHYEELAHHFSQGEEWAKAFPYLAACGCPHDAPTRELVSPA